MRLLGECRGSIDVVKEAEGELTADKDDVPGLTNPTVMDAQGKGQLVTHTSHLLSRHDSLLSSVLCGLCRIELPVFFQT